MGNSSGGSKWAYLSRLSDTGLQETLVLNANIHFLRKCCLQVRALWIVFQPYYLFSIGSDPLLMPQMSSISAEILYF